ncbi:hypothetical protein GCM10022286_22230 [Gryllotalpicola daejeonensis]|uniref:Uncharacterized protein n=1 Tax=Gryllotalpicola daejeonensis TaxID=993087 RepID=A0ABP7ZLA9_9MICO
MSATLTVVDFGPLADAAADYRLAVGRLEAAAADAETAWKQLPAALDSPGTQLAVGRYVGPAHQLSTALMNAADVLHNVLQTEVEPLRALSRPPEPDPLDLSWLDGADAANAARAEALAAAEAACAAAIAAIRGGEAGSVDLPCPTTPSASPMHVAPVSMAIPISPSAGFPAFGAGAIDAGAAAAAGAFALLGVVGLILSMGGSTDAAVPRRKRRPGPDAIEGKDFVITPYQECSPLFHGPGCQDHELGVDKPGDEPFTGDKVKGDEPPGEMPGTESDWTQRLADNGHGQVYKAPDGREVRVMDPAKTAEKEYDRRYPNGYVVFKRPGERPLDLSGKPSRIADDTHIVRNPDGSFPIPEGWNQ